MKLKTVAMTGVLSLAGLGLVGAGAHAVFTTTTSSSQTVSAGSPTVYTWASNAQTGCTTEALAESNGCTSITLTAATVGSTFDETSQVGVVNDGAIPVNLTSFTVTDSDLGASGVNGYFQSGLGLCIADSNGTVTQGLLLSDSSYNKAEAVTPILLGTGDYTVYDVDLYAGGNSTYCDAAVAALPSTAEGGADTVTITVGYTG
jgi:hypothetical protein